MTLVQTYPPLLIKKKKLFFLFLFFFFNISLHVDASTQNVTPIVRINNKLITNVDLNYEILLLEIQFKNKLSNRSILRNLAINNLIENQIKELETSKESIKIDIKEKNFLLESSLKNLFNDNVDLEYKKLIRNTLSKKIEISLKWSKLIQKKYISQIQINLLEINDIVKKNNLNSNQKNKLILEEKKKKLEIFSKSHFIKIKKNYVIKFL